MNIIRSFILKKNILFCFIFLLIVENPLFALDIFAPKAPPSLPLVLLTKDYNINFYNDLNIEILPQIIKNRKALYIIPTNVAAKLHSKNKELKIAGITSLGLLSFLTTKDYVSIKDLDKKEIYISAPGATPDILSQYFFKNLDIEPKINYRSAPEIAKLLIINKIENVVLPEPLATIAQKKNPKIKVLSLFTTLWSDLTKTRGMPQVCIASFDDIDREEIMIFFEKYTKALKEIEEKPTEALNAANSLYNFNINEDIFYDSYPKMNLVCIKADDMEQEILHYLNVLYDFSKDSVGGKPIDKEIFLH